MKASLPVDRYGAVHHRRGRRGSAGWHREGVSHEAMESSYAGATAGGPGRRIDRALR